MSFFGDAVPLPPHASRCAQHFISTPRTPHTHSREAGRGGDALCKLTKQRLDVLHVHVGPTHSHVLCCLSEYARASPRELLRGGRTRVRYNTDTNHLLTYSPKKAPQTVPRAPLLSGGTLLHRVLKKEEGRSCTIFSHTRVSPGTETKNQNKQTSASPSAYPFSLCDATQVRASSLAPGVCVLRPFAREIVLFRRGVLGSVLRLRTVAHRVTREIYSSRHRRQPLSFFPIPHRVVHTYHTVFWTHR